MSEKIKEITLPAKIDPLTGSIIPDGSTKFAAIISKFADKDNMLEITYKKLHRNRTARQNRYYWLLVSKIMVFWKSTQGENLQRQQVHAINLDIAGRKYESQMLVIPDRNGKLERREVIVFTHRSTKDMNTTEFTEFIETIREHWGAVGCNLPDPIGENYLSDHIK